MFRDGSFLLWNPATTEYKHLPLPYKVGVDVRYSFGFGYDHVDDDYHIVRFVHGIKSAAYLGTPFEIYSLRRNSWQKMCDISWNVKFLGWYSINTAWNFLDGKYYCLIHFADKFKRTGTGVQFTLGDGLTEEIMCFDLIQREIRLIKLPSDLSDCDNPVFELGVIKGSLCLFHYHDGIVDIWRLMSSEEQEPSWTKLILIPELIQLLNLPRYGRPLCSMENGEILVRVRMDLESKVYLLNPEETVLVGEFDDQERSFEFDKVILYKESLVSPNAIIGVRRPGSMAHERRGGSHTRIEENDEEDPYACRAMGRILHVTEVLN